MFTKAMMQNFRCFKEVDVPLKPLTVLIGKNDTGKSAFLDALMILSTKMKLILNQDIRLFEKSSRIDMLIQAKNDIKSRIRSPKNGISPINPVQLKTAKFNLPSDGPSMNSPGVADTKGPPGLLEQGDNVPALLDYFLRRDRQRFFKFVDESVRYIPGLKDIQIATPSPDLRRIDLSIDENFVIPADKVSVGVRVMLFFLALAYHPEPPELILIEEPEKGVHPKRLADIINLLRSLTTGEHSPIASQVIMTTHSPYLLDLIDLETDGVLIFQRNEDGSRSAHPADEEKLNIFLDEFHLGEVWYNEGEEGMVRQA